MEATIFYSRKNAFTVITFGVIALILVAVTVLTLWTKPLSMVWIPVVVVLAVLVWVWTRTFYSIDGNYLYYQSGPIRGKIAISQIRQMDVNQTLWVGFRPALSTGGIIIHYNKWDEIYISPKDSDRFVATLTTANENIQVNVKET
ncbi:PH domain-containing protein [Xanthocytophaga agilis]|uniref:PH domain-containing protein n=1 Tax=Xanthocytophaga agilis TaxID=3048010 RepID=A0AAE3UDN2_9BACT|nr:PH domain-containing protein [Xanthocytophaga agilis]MDJ1502033.1 PH domain-containing protein [Xanthocytophaga agilis]